MSEGVVVVIGAAAMGSIGHAVARRAAADGATVLAADIERPPGMVAEVEAEAGWEGLPSLVAEIEAAGGRAHAEHCDITDSAQVESLFEAARAHGPLVGMVNTTRAPLERSLPFTEMDDETWRRTLDVNLTGALTSSQAAARAMLEAGTAGSIVHISSVVSIAPQRGRTAYCVTKAALNTLVQLMALDLASARVRVNAVLPGVIATHRVDPDEQARSARLGLSVAEQRRKLLESQSSVIPFGRPGRPEEVAAAVAFLLGEDSSYVTGELIRVGGGLLSPVLSDESPGGPPPTKTS